MHFKNGKESVNFGLTRWRRDARNASFSLLSFHPILVVTLRDINEIALNKKPSHHKQPFCNTPSLLGNRRFLLTDHSASVEIELGDETEAVSRDFIRKLRCIQNET